MRAIRKTIFMTFLLALVTAGMATTGHGPVWHQRRGHSGCRATNSNAHRLSTACSQNAADRNNYRVDDINRLILDFESCCESTRSASGFAPYELRQTRKRCWIAARRSTLSLSNNRLGAGSRREWQAIRTDLDQLASYYNLNAPWNQAAVSAEAETTITT